MLKSLYQVDFNEIYVALLSNPESMNTYDECMAYLKSLNIEVIRKWIAKSADNKEIQKDFANIIDYYLDENGE